jgi:glycosyltransferase involved in cell wall biosynthesis
MKILVVSNMYPSKEKPYSGLFVVNQVKAIQDKLNEDDILDFYYMERTFTNKLGSVIKYIKFFINFIYFIRRKKIKYDIIHIHYYFPTIYIALVYKFINKNVKVIVTFHGGDFHNRNHHLLYKFPLKYIDGVIAVSKKLGQKIINNYKLPKKNYILSAGINNIFTHLKCKKEYDLIYVGSFFKIKGFDIFCKVIEEIKEPLSICIVGSGNLKYILESIKDKLVHNIDLYENTSQKDLIILYNKSKFLINTSRKEGFGLVLSESMACGTPVIATETDGALEQIKNNENGLLCKIDIDDFQTVINIKNKIIEALSYNDFKYRKLVEKSLVYAEKQKLSSISLDVVNIYKEILNEN